MGKMKSIKKSKVRGATLITSAISKTGKTVIYEVALVIKVAPLTFDLFSVFHFAPSFRVKPEYKVTGSPVKPISNLTTIQPDQCHGWVLYNISK